MRTPLFSPFWSWCKQLAHDNPCQELPETQGGTRNKVSKALEEIYRGATKQTTPKLLEIRDGTGKRSIINTVLFLLFP